MLGNLDECVRLRTQDAYRAEAQEHSFVHVHASAYARKLPALTSCWGDVGASSEIHSVTSIHARFE